MGPSTRTLVLAIFGLIIVCAPRDAESAPRAADACIPADKCCRICDDGQACGNSCISRKKTCHKGRGCACNAGEVCGER